MSPADRPAPRHYDVAPLEGSSQAMAEVLDLFVQGGSSKTTTTAYLDWQYNQNPNGPAVGFNAYADGELAAHYVTVPIRARVLGRDARGLVSINTRTAAAHQGQGLFTRLARLTYDHARALGYEFVIGAANQNSVHGFINKLGFEHCGRLETRIVAWPAPKALEACEYETEWDEASLRWRLANPNKRYEARRRDGRALIFGPSLRFRALLGDAPEAALPADIPAAGGGPALWVGANGGRIWRASPSLVAPQRFREATLHLIFLDLTGRGAPAPERMKFSGLDFDAY